MPLGPGPGIEVDVRAESDGSEPVGLVSVTPGSYYFRLPDSGPATCLRIVGNRVAIGFVVVDPTGAGMPDISQVVFVEDNGPSGDRWARVTVPDAPLDCPDPSTAAVSWTTPVSGNITITDR